MNAPPALQSQTIVGRKGALMEVLVIFLESKLATSSQVNFFQITLFFHYDLKQYLSILPYVKRLLQS